MIAVAGGEDFVDDADGGLGSDLRIAIGGIDGEVVFDPLQVGAEGFQLVGFGVVPEVDVGFEGGFIAEDFVVVGFVGTDSDVDGSVEIHPGEIAGVVVVRQKRRRAKLEETLEGLVGSEGGGLAKERGCFHEIGMIGLAVSDGCETAVFAANDAEEAGGERLLCGGKGFEPGFEFNLRHVFGIEVGARRFDGGDAGKEGGVGVEIGPGSFIQPEVTETGFAERGVVEF